MLSCPSCGHDQSESARALSTYCRQCGEYYKIENGASVSKHAAAPNIFREASAPTPSPQSSQSGETPAKEPTAPNPQNAPRSRDIDCLACGHLHRIPGHASMTVCPRCGEQISLQDFEIRGKWDRPIRTRGKVILFHDSVVRNINIECHHLVIEGEFHGRVNCTGNLTIRNDATITGEVRCRRVAIENQATVAFENAIQAEEVSIDGQVDTPRVHARRITLETKAHLRADIEAHTLVINNGAQQTGEVRVSV